VVVLIMIVGVAIASVNRTGPVTSSNPATNIQPAAPPTQAQPPGVATWGQRFTFPDGLAIEVSQPKPYQPSRSAAGDSRGRAVVVDTTIVNGTGTPYEFNSFIVGPTATHAGQHAPSIVDLGKRIGVTPLTTVLPGKSFTYQQAFSVGTETGELQLQYTAEVFGEAAIFVGPA
jgi:hypothetical protein